MRTPIAPKKPPFKKHPLTVAIQAISYSILGMAPLAHATTGGQVVGGSGAITQSGTNTTINQASQNLAINWQTFNVAVNERVQFIQPNASAIALNRILSNNGSTIAGRIDANGKVILVNPNGIFFTPTSVLNVGSLIASGLTINPADFMNGNYIFNEMPGTNGTVINSGTINASLGGNVALLGKRVENNGLVSATLGSVTLAAGKQAVLTFDNGGLLGVRVSQEILQSELGMDPAVLNSGTINAQGGRVLLTASVSKDIFSQAVNTNGIQPATSVVVNADGTFSLGSGADVVNSGTIDTSTTSAAQSVGRIVLIGENVTSSGTLKADAQNGNGGEIELHARDMALLTENSMTSARSESNGQGGIVKVLGDKVGLFDQSTVDVSGANGGGQALIGGDFQGKNLNIRNASATIINPGASIYADALTNGNGGNVIVWSDGTTYFAGSIFARGGALAGNGGFVETSGKANLLFRGHTDRSAINGQAGTLLLDPHNITIETGAGGPPLSSADDAALVSGRSVSFGECTPVGSCDNAATTDDFSISATRLRTELEGGNVLLQAYNDIIFNAVVAPTSDNSSLTLQAGRSIEINANITLRGGDFIATINDAGGAAGRDTGNAAFTMASGTTITTNGGAITIGTGNTTDLGNITLYALNSSRTSGGDNAGNINVTNDIGDIILHGNILANGRSRSGDDSGAGGIINLTANAGLIDLKTTGRISSDGGSSTDLGTTGRNGGNAGAISLSANNIDINGPISANGGNRANDGNFGSANNITFTAGQNFTIASSVSALRINNATNGTDGAITINGSTGANIFNINTGASFAGASVTVNGNFGIDTLRRGGLTATTNTWNIFDFDGVTSVANGQDDGTLVFGTNTVRFVDVENLTGNSLADNFVVQLGGSLTGLIDGGAGVADTLTINPSGVNVGLGNQTAGNLHVDRVETITTSVASNTLTGSNLANYWIINGTTSGSVSGTAPPGTPAPDANVAFSGFGTVSGGSLADTFAISDNFVGTINGGAADDIFNINAGASIAGTVNGDAGVDTFNIAGSVAAAGVLNGGADGDFYNINTGASIVGTINGDTGVDTFNINAGSSVAGTINGDAGLDVFNLSASVAGTVNGGDDNDTFNVGVTGITLASLNGNAGSDTFNINATGVTISSLDGGTVVGDVDTLRGPDAANYWYVNASGNSTLGQSSVVLGNPAVSFSGIEVLTGGTGTGVDTFTVNAGATIGSLNGAGGNDVFVITGAVTGLIDGGASTGTGDQLTITTPGNVTVQLGSTPNIGATLRVDQVETINAMNGATGNTLIGPDSTTNTNIWIVGTGTATNTVAYGATTTTLTTFSNFTHLVGGSGVDDFTVNTSIGSIDAKAGNDLITIASPGLLTSLVPTTSSAIVGGDGIDTLTVSGTTSKIWSITNLTTNTGSVAVAGNATQATTFTGVETRVGSTTGADVIDLSSAGLGAITVNVADYLNFGTIIGNGSMTLQGQSQAGVTNAWSVQQVIDPRNTSLPTLTDGVNDGTVNTVTRFIDFSILSGGTFNDNFTITAAGSITGSIIGNGGTNTLIGRNAANTWTLTSAATNSLGVTSGGIYVANFTGIQQLIGGNGADVLSIADAGVTIVQLGPVLSAGAQLGADSIETINATNGATNTLRGDNGGNTWTVSGANSGNINTNAINFSGFANLVGGTGIDTFNVNANIVSISTGNGATNSVTVALGAAVSGAITGGTGIDTIAVNGSAGSISSGDNNDILSVAGTVGGLIDGGAGTGDQLTITTVGSQIVQLGTTASAGTNLLVNSIETINANNGAVNTLRGDAGNNLWTVTSLNSGNINGAPNFSFSGFSNLEGGAGIDTFNVNANIVSISTGNGATNSVTVALGAAVSGAITGGTGIDTIAVNGSAGSISSGDNNDILSVAGTVGGLIDGGAGNDAISVSGSAGSIHARDGNNNVTILAGGRVFGSIASDAGNDIVLVNGNVGSISVGDGSNSVTVGAGVSSGNITAGTGDDTITVSGTVGSITLGDGANNSATVALGGVAGAITGGTGIDTITVGGAATSISTFAANDVLSLGGTVTGLIDGGAGTGLGDRLTITGAIDKTVQLGGVVTNPAPDYRVAGIEDITVQNSGTVNSRLIGANGTNTWTIDGENSGRVVDGATTTTFRGFANLQGGTGSDTFTLTNNSSAVVLGSLRGLLDGGGFTTGVGAGDSVTVNYTPVGNQPPNYLLDIVDALPATQINNAPDAYVLTVFRGGTVGGANTTTVSNADNVWNIGPTGVFLVTATTVGPGTQITSSNLIGGNRSDTFNWLGGSVSGLVDGRGGDNSLVITAAGDKTILLGGIANTTPLPANQVMRVNNIQTITGNSASTNTIVGANSANAWDIKPVTINTYNYFVTPPALPQLVSSTLYPVNSGTVTNGGFMTTFANFRNITGGTATDNFRLSGNGSLSGFIRGGGGGADTLTIDSTMTRAMNVQLIDVVPAAQVVNQANTLAVYQVNTINGNSTADILVGANIANTWSINGANSGSVSDGAFTTNFTNFANLTGGTGVDRFNVVKVAATGLNGSISGNVHTGLGGADVLNVNLSGTETGQVSLIVDAGATATVNIQDAVGGISGNYNGVYESALAGFDQFVYRNGANAFTIRYSDTPTTTTVNANLTTETLGINGRAGFDDTITLGTGTFSVNASTPVNYSRVTNLTVNGQTGVDTINLGVFSIAGALSLTAETVAVPVAGRITATTLILDNVGQFGTAAPTATSTGPINTTIGTLQLANAVGSVYINETDNLNLITSGTVTNSGVFRVAAGTTTINAGNGGSLTLDNVLNDFNIVNTENGINAASINLRDANSINGGSITATNIALAAATGVTVGTRTANLTITNTSGVVNVTNDQQVQVDIATTGDINLTNTGNVVVKRLYSNGDSTAAGTGNVVLRTTVGSGGAVSAYTGPGSHTALAAPDIVAQNLTVSIQGNFGAPNPGRNMSIRVSGDFTFFGSRGYVYYFGGRPTNVFGVENLVVFSGLAELSTQQLIEVESLDEFDPAIFTAVRNYSYEDVAILMPADQRLDAADEDEKEKEKEEKL